MRRRHPRLRVPVLVWLSRVEIIAPTTATDAPAATVNATFAGYRREVDAAEVAATIQH